MNNAYSVPMSAPAAVTPQHHQLGALSVSLIIPIQEMLYCQMELGVSGLEEVEIQLSCRPLFSAFKYTNARNVAV